MSDDKKPAPAPAPAVTKDEAEKAIGFLDAATQPDAKMNRADYCNVQGALNTLIKFVKGG